jgi:hypothetical protein
VSGTLRLITADTAVGFGALVPEFGVFAVTGASGNPYTALSDSDDASYISWTSGPATSVMRFEMSDPVDMPAGARPYGLQASVRIARTDVLPAGTLPAVYYRIHNGEYVGGPSGVPDYTNTNSAVAPLTTPTTFHGVIENKVSSGEQMDQATLNRLTLEVFGLNATVLRLYEAYIDAYYDEMPVATVTGPTGQIQSTASPIVTWTYADDLQPQVAYQVEIYHGTGTTSAAYLSGERTGAATSFQIPVVLANGNYTVRVRVAQKWPYAGSAFWGNWSTGTFSIAAAAFSTPDIHVNQFHGFNELEAQHNANLLSFNEAAGQDNSSEWSSLITGARAVFFSDTTYHTGPFGFRMTSRGAGTETARRDIPYIIAKRGQSYRFQGFFNLESTSTPCNVLLGLEFFDQNMNPVTTGYLGDAVTEEHGRWITPKVDGEAPDDGFVRPYIRWDGAVDNDYHYFDDMALWMTGDDFAEPQLGRGHLLYDQAPDVGRLRRQRVASGWPQPFLGRGCRYRRVGFDVGHRLRQHGHRGHGQLPTDRGRWQPGRLRRSQCTAPERHVRGRDASGSPQHGPAHPRGRRRALRDVWQGALRFGHHGTRCDGPHGDALLQFERHLFHQRVRQQHSGAHRSYLVGLHGLGRKRVDHHRDRYRPGCLEVRHRAQRGGLHGSGARSGGAHRGGG